MVTYGSRETVPGPRIVGDTKTTTATELELLRKVDHHPNKPRVLLAAFTGKASSLIGKLEQKDQKCPL